MKKPLYICITFILLSTLFSGCIDDNSEIKQKSITGTIFDVQITGGSHGTGFTIVVFNNSEFITFDSPTGSLVSYKTSPTSYANAYSQLILLKGKKVEINYLTQYKYKYFESVDVI